VSPLAFRFHVAMMGVLGIGGNILHWTDAELAEARAHVEAYKRIRPTVQLGTQYWLAAPSLDKPCAVQYVSEDRRETVVLLYQVRGRVGQGHRRFRLHGLDSDRRYRRMSLDGLAEASMAESTGAALMGSGLPVFPDAPPVPLHAQDWQSEIQVWQAADL
jgi:alpha-galactosidase